MAVAAVEYAFLNFQKVCSIQEQKVCHLKGTI